MNRPYVQVNTLQLADIVTLCHGENALPFSDCIVKHIDAQGNVTLERPYMSNADFSMSGGAPGATSVIVYMGHEDIKLPPSNYVYLVKRARGLK